MRLRLTTDQRKRRESAVREILDPAVLRTLRKEQLWRIIKALSLERKTRYVRRRKKRYGNICRGFTEEELALFFQHCTNPTARMAFELMAYLGLRVGEVVSLNVHPSKSARQSWAYVDLIQRKVWLQTEKADTADYCQLHERIYPRLAAWLQAHEREIRAHEGYVLYSTNPIVKRLAISPNWLRNEFRNAARRAGLDQSYGPSDEPEGKRSRRLFRLTTHSLRHYFITSVYRSTKDPVVAQRLARHTDNKSTFVYIHTTEHDLDRAISAAFGTPQIPEGPTRGRHKQPETEPGLQAPPAAPSPCLRYRLIRQGRAERLELVDPAKTEQLVTEVRAYMAEFAREEILQHLVNYASLAEWYVSGIKVQETPQGQDAYAFMVELVARLRKRPEAAQVWNRWALGRIGQIEVRE